MRQISLRFVENDYDRNLIDAFVLVWQRRFLLNFQADLQYSSILLGLLITQILFSRKIFVATKSKMSFLFTCFKAFNWIAECTRYKTCEYIISILNWIPILISIFGFHLYECHLSCFQGISKSLHRCYSDQF